MGEVRFPTRDVDVRNICSRMLGLSKIASDRLTKEELLDLCEKRGYIKTVKTYQKTL